MERGIRDSKHHRVKRRICINFIYIYFISKIILIYVEGEHIYIQTHSPNFIFCNLKISIKMHTRLLLRKKKRGLSPLPEVINW